MMSMHTDMAAASPKHVDEREHFVLEEVPDSYFQIVVQHLAGFGLGAGWRNGSRKKGVKENYALPGSLHAMKMPKRTKGLIRPI
jgi:hypothetical protein